MTVLPVPYIPPQIQRFTNETPPANLLILGKVKPIAASPQAMDGSGLPDDKITPYSGIYDANGRLPTIPGTGLTFIAYA